MKGERPPVPRHTELRPFYCTKCGRVVYYGERDFNLWLIAHRVNGSATLVVRCPQHITQKVLILSGRRRTRRMYTWARDVKFMDPYPERCNEVSWMHPQPIPESEFMAVKKRTSRYSSLRYSQKIAMRTVKRRTEKGLQ